MRLMPEKNVGLGFIVTNCGGSRRSCVQHDAGIAACEKKWGQATLKRTSWICSYRKKQPVPLLVRYGKVGLADGVVSDGDASGVSSEEPGLGVSAGRSVV